MDIVDSAGMFAEAIVTENADDYGVEVEKLPAIIIMDTKEVVLKAYMVEEAVNFLKERV